MQLLSRINPRQRAGVAIIALVYLVGYTLGRAGGRADTAIAILRGCDAAGTRGT